MVNALLEYGSIIDSIKGSDLDQIVAQYLEQDPIETLLLLLW